MILLNEYGERLVKKLPTDQNALDIAATANADLAEFLRVLAGDPNGMCRDVGKYASRVVLGMARLVAQCNVDLDAAMKYEVEKLLG